MEQIFDMILGELGYGDAVRDDVYNINKRCKRVSFCNNALYQEFFVDIMLGNAGNKYFNNKGNLLIVADRLYGIGIGLEYYFKKNTKFTIVGVAKTYEEALDFSEQVEVNIIVVVGYQENTENYGIIQKLKQRDKANSFMWAHIDELTVLHRDMYCMTGIFDRNKPLQDFVEYINFFCS